MLRAPLGAKIGGRNVGHHRYKIRIDAVIEAPRTVLPGQDPSDQSLAETIKGKLRNVPVGGTYDLKVETLKVKKNATADP